MFFLLRRRNKLLHKCRCQLSATDVVLKILLAISKN
jgi:hypothetical protein